ncbi:peptidylprolyl isomerase [Sphingomonas morindae]|uniref:Peptidyl-prolyl cis-trans isomerase n=1 Tax=Sphingomonas morindae TaxID=1541170 RepID=A0ABY4X7K9_9SPHN|nr:peptidylprolyl isomerase [Sphingomonas morindae]USI72923.1 peptidylprolyl isomerase [Sphingomonas morindae]
MIRSALLTFAACLAVASPALAKKTTKIQAAGTASRVEDFLPPKLTPDNEWNLDLSDGGRVVIQLRPDMAPKMVERIKTLTAQGFYNGLMFHRVIEGFMAQGGDPKGTGEGGSTLPDVPAEFNDLPHVRGAVAAARAADENSANSQFYIMFMPNLKLDRHYTVFGRVVSGMAYVDAIQRGEPPATPTRIVRASIGDVPPLTAAQLAPPPPVQAPAALPSGPITPTPVTPVTPTRRRH